MSFFGFDGVSPILFIDLVLSRVRRHSTEGSILDFDPNTYINHLGSLDFHTFKPFSSYLSFYLVFVCISFRFLDQPVRVGGPRPAAGLERKLSLGQKPQLQCGRGSACGVARPARRKSDLECIFLVVFVVMFVWFLGLGLVFFGFGLCFRRVGFFFLFGWFEFFGS